MEGERPVGYLIWVVREGRSEEGTSEQSPESQEGMNHDRKQCM